jgi:glycosyltransferase involved in cell wall biosynthesis
VISSTPTDQLTGVVAGCRVAVVHEWVDAYAGSEQVFEAFAQLLPDADLFALSVKPGVELDVGGRAITTTALDTDRWRDRRGLTLPVMPWAWRQLGRRDYDVVITSHHAFAHANRLTRPGGTHLAYVHSPARYVWSPDIDERGRGAALAPARALLRRVDRKASGRVDAYAVNSVAVADRVREFWGRESTVINPPVRVGFFSKGRVSTPRRDYVLGVGRWIPYKNLHLVVEAADLLGMPVKIAGRGPDRSRIEAAAAAASVPVSLIESPDDNELRDLFAHAACLVFPTVEDFGMVPVEAQAAGTPVVALAAGGALETVVDGVSGAFAADSNPGTIAAAANRAMTLDPAGPASNAELFSQQAFENAVAAWIVEALEARS